MCPYFYTETAFHHEGDFNFMLKLIDETKKSGANGIKFQVLIEADALISVKHSAYDKLSKCVFTSEQWLKIFAYSLKKKLDFIIMPLDTKAFDVINKISDKIKFLELHSVLYKDKDIIRLMKSSGMNIIISAGGRTLEEIYQLKKVFGRKLKVIMSGFQAFPSRIEDVKLGRIAEYKKLFPEQLIGYADHSAYNDSMAIESNIYAYLLGARIFEKHITFKEGRKRIDFESAISFKKMTEIIRRINNLETLFYIDSSKIFKMSEPEIKYRQRERKVVAGKNIKASEKITSDKLLFRMIDASDSISDINLLIGRKSISLIPKGETVTSEKLL